MIVVLNIFYFTISTNQFLQCIETKIKRKVWKNPRNTIN